MIASLGHWLLGCEVESAYLTKPYQMLMIFLNIFRKSTLSLWTKRYLKSETTV